MVVLRNKIGLGIGESDMDRNRQQARALFHPARWECVSLGMTGWRPSRLKLYNVVDWCHIICLWGFICFSEVACTTYCVQFFLFCFIIISPFPSAR